MYADIVPYTVEGVAARLNLEVLLGRGFYTFELGIIFGATVADEGPPMVVVGRGGNSGILGLLPPSSGLVTFLLKFEVPSYC